MEIASIYKKFEACASVSTDTRKINKNDMYFALKGDNFDGNKFVKQAFESGAKYCVIDDKNAATTDNCILVDNVLTTLQDLANYHRNVISVPIISLTGSNGKTTTKELIKAVLNTKFNVNATKGNLNNHIGVPLTILSFTKDLDFGIVEMGANHQKEIEFLCRIAEPDFGLITNFGKAHLEGFGGEEGVIKGKSELYDFIKSNKKIAFINTDDPKQLKQISDYPNIVSFGKDQENDCTVEFKSADPFVNLNYKNIEIKSQLIGDYNYNNIAVAVAIGQHFNVPSENIKNAIESYQPNNNRSQIIKRGSTKIILDAYNANPTSMLAALKNLKQLNAEHKYLFLGDMFELGKEAEKEHQAIANYVENNFNNHIVLVGENFYKTNTKLTSEKFKSFEDLKPFLKTLDIKNSTVLIKGSRGMALERILEFL